MVSTVPLNSSAFYGPSLSALSRATNEISTSTARLASGNRLVKAGDDVAALSISTRLRSQVLNIKAAQSNATQGNSFLQVAYGAITQVRELLDSLRGIAVQANSGSITTSDRELLQQEFDGLKAEIDRIAENTTFNNIALLDGSVSGENIATTTKTKATQASGALTFTANATAGQTVVLNGVTFTAAASASTATEFTIGATTTDTVANLRTVLNNSTNTAISQATYSASGTTLTITQDAGGTGGNQYSVDKATSTTSFTVSGTATPAANVYTLSGGLNDGLRAGSVTATGSIGDSLVNTQSQTKSSVTLTITGSISNGELLRIDNGNGSLVDFTFATTASAATDIQIGSTTEETLQNAIETISQYSASGNVGSRQLEFQRDGDQLIIRSKQVGNPKDLAGANLDISETLTNGSLSASAFSNGTSTGVDTTGVNNSDFVGTIDGFTATYVGTDSLTASVTVGSHTYTAAITDTTPGSLSTARFFSSTGGYFDVQLGATGLAVSNQTTADTYAARLNAAFSTLSFSQSRNVNSFAGVNGMAGGSAEISGDDFSRIQIEDISVTKPSGSGEDATIEFTINGDTYRSASGIGGSMGAYETFTFTSITDSSKTLKVTNGGTANDFSTTNAAATFETALRNSFGLNSTGSGLDFQVGVTSSDVINVNIGDARTSKLFNGDTPLVSTQDDAEDAITTIDSALEAIGGILADVGSLQTRFDAAFNNLENARIYIDQARSELADTDIADESTSFALATLRANAATSVIAQASKLQSSMLDILKAA